MVEEQAGKTHTYTLGRRLDVGLGGWFDLARST